MRWFSVLLLTLIACGTAACNTISGSDIKSEQLKASGTGVAVLSASAGHDGCQRTDVAFGQYDPVAGGWRVTREAHFMSQNGRSDGPVGFTLQEGRYGILKMTCTDSRVNIYRSKDLRGGQLFEQSVYETALAVFEVKSGEAVVIGRIETRQSYLKISDAMQTGRYYVMISPLPAKALEAFRARNPGLAQSLVHRTMTPGKPPGTARSR
ncbi:MAG: hypothetical protein O9972_37605 [Burkholderiales bacterium]|nr:hypothetical protein [Burkholderiales bacterium]